MLRLWKAWQSLSFCFRCTLRSWPSAFVVSSSSYPFAFIKFFESSNSIVDFLVDVLVNPFGDFGIDVFLNLVINPVSFPILGWFLWDNFFALAVDAFSALRWDVPPNHPSSADCLLFSLLSLDNFTTSKHLDHLPNPSPFSLFPSFGNSTYNRWTLCSTCLPSIISAKYWHWKICYLSEKRFLDGMFLLGTIKYLLLYIYDNYFQLLASKLYIVGILLAKLRS